MKKLSNRLKNKSIEYLTKYLLKRRDRPLQEWKEKKIKTIIIKKLKGLDEFATRIEQSPLYKLAETEIMREGYKTEHEILPEKTLLMMFKIVKTANEQGQQKRLDEYCEGFIIKK